MKLIGRYVFREVLGSSIIVLGVLFAILMSDQFADILGDASANELPRDAVFAVLGLTAVQFLGLLAPFALFLGVMMALARLNRDSETAALAACGIGPMQLLVPIGILATVLAAAVGWLSTVGVPAALGSIERIRAEARTRVEVAAIQPGTFLASESDDGAVFYAERVEGEALFDVFWARETGAELVVVVAERGERRVSPETGAVSFALFNGTRYAGTPGDPDFSIFEFAEHGIPVRDAGETDFEETLEMRHWRSLLRSAERADRTELEWRLVAPLSMLILAALAIPLSRSAPRDGRYARIGIGMLVFMAYSNILSLARLWSEQGTALGQFGLWWVHLGAVVLALTLIGRQSGWLRRPLPLSGARA